MGVIALAFLDPRSSRGPQRLPESAIWKSAYLALEPKRFEILNFAASVTSIDFEGGLFKHWLPNFEIEKSFFFPWIRHNFFSRAQNRNFAEIMPWRINLSLQKYTFCDNLTKIVGQSWFGNIIYPRALSLGCWPLNFRIKILKYSFSLVFVKKIWPYQTNGSKDNWGQ